MANGLLDSRTDRHSIGRNADISPEVKLVMRLMAAMMHYLVERVPTLKGARAFAELFNAPFAEFQKKWWKDGATEKEKT